MILATLSNFHCCCCCFWFKNIAFIECCQVEKLIATYIFLNNQLWTVAHLTTQKVAEW